MSDKYKIIDEKLERIGIHGYSKEFQVFLDELRTKAINHCRSKNMVLDQELIESIIFTPIFSALENSIRFMYKNLIDIENQGYMAYKKEFLNEMVKQLMEIH